MQRAQARPRLRFYSSRPRAAEQAEGAFPGTVPPCGRAFCGAGCPCARTFGRREALLTGVRGGGVCRGLPLGSPCRDTAVPGGFENAEPTWLPRTEEATAGDASSEGSVLAAAACPPAGPSSLQAGSAWLPVAPRSREGLRCLRRVAEREGEVGARSAATLRCRPCGYRADAQPLAVGAARAGRALPCVCDLHTPAIQCLPFASAVPSPAGVT